MLWYAAVEDYYEHLHRSIRYQTSSQKSYHSLYLTLVAGFCARDAGFGGLFLPMHRQRLDNNFLVEMIGEQCFGMLRGMVMKNTHAGAFGGKLLHKKVIIESL